MRFDKGQNAYYLCLRLILSCHGHCTGAVVTCTSVHKALRALSATSLPGFLSDIDGRSRGSAQAGPPHPPAAHLLCRSRPPFPRTTRGPEPSLGTGSRLRGGSHPLADAEDRRG